MKRTKNMKKAYDGVDRSKRYSLEEAVSILQGAKYAKFDESVEVALRLGVDPKRADQMVRGTVSLPHGVGKKVRVLVFAQGEKDAEAKEAGADFVGSDELVEKIQGGWLDFDVAVATPDMMKTVGRLGKTLGARGLMPSPKAGTVTMDVGRTVKELKAGRIEYRVDRQSGIAAAVGKVSFEPAKLAENIRAFVGAVVKAKPSAAKGKYIVSMALSSTMGPGLKLDESTVVGD
ncbi:MAG TPA: 50S ribosomal protein L1 [candidate division Zixibacteria bacterium]|nr:50S ribosomal protein L1 [candidate division Zixibacteria bacterium]